MTVTETVTGAVTEQVKKASETVASLVKDVQGRVSDVSGKVSGVQVKVTGQVKEQAGAIRGVDVQSLANQVSAQFSAIDVSAILEDVSQRVRSFELPTREGLTEGLSEGIARTGVRQRAATIVGEIKDIKGIDGIKGLKSQVQDLTVRIKGGSVETPAETPVDVVETPAETPVDVVEDVVEETGAEG